MVAAVSSANKRKARYEALIDAQVGRLRLGQVWRWLLSEVKRLPVDRQTAVADRIRVIAAELNREAGDR